MPLPSFLSNEGEKVISSSGGWFAIYLSLALAFAFLGWCAHVSFIRYALWFFAFGFGIVALVEWPESTYSIGQYLMSKGFLEWYLVKMKYGYPLAQDGYTAYLVVAYDRDGKEHEFVLLEKGDGYYRRDL